jgi:hypothetical protein
MKPDLERGLLVAQSALVGGSAIGGAGHDFPSADLIEFDIVQLNVQRHFRHPDSQRARALHITITGHQGGVGRAADLRPVQVDGRARRRHLEKKSTAGENNLK